MATGSVHDVVESDREAESNLAVRAATDPAAFAVLYRTYLNPVFRYCYRRLGSREAAEDATQLIFEKALAALPKYRKDGAFRSWLFTIAFRTLIDVHRTNHPTVSIDAVETLQDPSPTPEDLAIRTDDMCQIRALLGQFGEQPRQLIELRLAGLNDVEIAQLLGKSHASVRVMQYRTLLQLRSLLGVEGGAKEPSDVRA